MDLVSAFVAPLVWGSWTVWTTVAVLLGLPVLVGALVANRWLAIGCGALSIKFAAGVVLIAMSEPLWHEGITWGTWAFDLGVGAGLALLGFTARRFGARVGALMGHLRAARRPV